MRHDSIVLAASIKASRKCGGSISPRRIDKMHFCARFRLTVFACLLSQRMPMNHAPIDLHIHTSYSDGRYPPEDVLRYASARGMETLAFTDHDNANGYRAALPTAEKLGIRLIPGVEFTTRWPHCEAAIADFDVDILGYGVDVECPAFRAFEKAALQDMFARIQERCAILSEAGYPLTLDDVFAENPHYAGTIYLLYAIQRKGYAVDRKDAWRILDLSRTGVRLSSFSVYRGIEQIHRAGGVAVLAHPTAITREHPWFEANHLAMLMEMGLDGIEVYHPHLTNEARAYFEAMADQFHLVVSGGSDLHGWTDGLKRFGRHGVTPAMLERLEQRIEARKRLRAGAAASSGDA